MFYRIVQGTGCSQYLNGLLLAQTHASAWCRNESCTPRVWHPVSSGMLALMWWEMELMWTWSLKVIAFNFSSHEGQSTWTLILLSEVQRDHHLVWPMFNPPIFLILVWTLRTCVYLLQKMASIIFSVPKLHHCSAQNRDKCSHGTDTLNALGLKGVSHSSLYSYSSDHVITVF